MIDLPKWLTLILFSYLYDRKKQVDVENLNNLFNLNAYFALLYLYNIIAANIANLIELTKILCKSCYMFCTSIGSRRGEGRVKIIKM